MTPQLLTSKTSMFALFRAVPVVLCGAFAGSGLVACAEGQSLSEIPDDDGIGTTTPSTDDDGEPSTTGSTSNSEKPDTQDSSDASSTSVSTMTSTSDTSATTSTTTSTTTAECGNGEQEGNEACDGTDFADQSCVSLGFVGGSLRCTAACAFDTAMCNRCGNDLVEVDEDCDGANLNGKTTCADLDLGSASEALSCRADCTYDLSQCGACGDGTIMPPEDCEPAGSTGEQPNLNGADCKTLGFDGGVLACSSGCGFDTSGCFACGDGTKHPLEECDGTDFGSATCATFNGADGKPFESGNLICSSACGLSTNSCWTCGDGAVSGDELCDGGNLDGKSCQTLGHSAGSLACAPTCLAFNESACTDCGDGMQEGTEQCDLTDLDGKVCKDVVGVGGGMLMCSPTCTFDTQNCDMNSCGDSIINGSDLCDCGPDANCTASELAGKTCTDLNFDGGKLSCRSPSNCTFDTTACYKCGDGKVNPGEDCDGTDLASKTCKDVGDFDGGALSCSAACDFNTSACTRATRIEFCDELPEINFSLNSSILVSTSRAEHQTVKSIEVALKLRENWMGEVAVTLISPHEDNRLLVTPGVATMGSFGCSGDNVDATFADDASVAGNNMCEASVPAIRGRVKPFEPFSAHVGKAINGTWALRVEQYFEVPGSATTGSIDSFCVYIYY